MDIDVLSGPPGCGKSTAMRLAAIQKPGLYFFALPTISLIREQAEAFRTDAKRLGIPLEIIEADSKARGSGSVQKRLNDAAARMAAERVQHAVVLTTHESMMGCDLSAFDGWHARIDEAPNAVQSGIVKAPASVSLLERAFALEPVGATGWAEVQLIMPTSGWRALADDDLLKPLAEFMKQAQRSHGVFVDTLKWSKSFGWCSVWLPTSLSHFASCQIAGASYGTSLGAVIATRWLGGAINFRSQPLPMHRQAHPKVRVHYFTQSHEGTSKLWSEHVGRGFIVKLCDFLTRNEPNLGFWGGNTEVEILMDHRVHGGPIPPKVLGLNQYRDRTSCAFIYSSKPMPQDEPAQRLFGLTGDEVRRSREDEDIIQFAMRGAIRTPEFGGDYDIYVYSKRQAETLVGQLSASGVGQSVTLVPEPSAGIMDVDAAPLKTVRKALSTKKAKARKNKDADRKRRQRRDAAIAAGRTPSANNGKGGRPPKSVSPTDKPE